jgi:hypothetical protein
LGLGSWVKKYTVPSKSSAPTTASGRLYSSPLLLRVVTVAKRASFMIERMVSRSSSEAVCPPDGVVESVIRRAPSVGGSGS